MVYMCKYHQSLMIQMIRHGCRAASSTTATSKMDPNNERLYSMAKPFKSIPGPDGYPYIGTMPKYRKGPLQKYTIDNYQEAVMDMHKKYGKIAKDSIAGTTTVHLFDPDYIRAVFQSEGKTPYVAPLMVTTQKFRETAGMSLGLGNTNGEEWYKLRRAVQNMIRPQEVSTYLPLVRDVANSFIERLLKIRQDNGHVENLRNEISKWNVKSASMTVFETRLNCLDDGPTSEVQQMIDANIAMFSLSAKLQFKLPIHNHAMMKNFSSMFRTWTNVIKAEQCIYRTTTQYFDDALQDLVALTDGDDYTKGRYNFLVYLLHRTNLNMKDATIIVLSLFTDGLSTTSPTLTSFLYCLARYPEAQEKVYAEIQNKMPNNEEVDASVLGRMPYLKAFVKEAFRFFPIGLDVSRISTDYLEIGGYQIPAGTHLKLNNFVMFKDPQYFEDPESFKLERWLRDGSAKNIHPYILTPFGHGPRMCAGRRFAEQELYVMIIKILQNFRLEWKHEHDLKQKYQILMVPDAPVDITFHSRDRS